MRRADAVGIVLQELDMAEEKHGAFNSNHEGYAVIQEEVDQLWDEIKHDDRGPLKYLMEDKAKKVAAMAIRFLVDLIPGEEEPEVGGQSRDVG